MKLSENIAKLTVILENKEDLNKNLKLLKDVEMEVQRNIKRFIKDDSAYLCFNAFDLEQLSDAAIEYLRVLNNRMVKSKLIKKIYENDTINNKVLNDFTLSYADDCYAIKHLTEFNNVIAYLSLYLELLEEQYRQGELDYVLIQTIKEYLGK